MIAGGERPPRRGHGKGDDPVDAKSDPPSQPGQWLQRSAFSSTRPEGPASTLTALIASGEALPPPSSSADQAKGAGRGSRLCSPITAYKHLSGCNGWFYPAAHLECSWEGRPALKAYCGGLPLTTPHECRLCGGRIGLLSSQGLSPSPALSSPCRTASRWDLVGLPSPPSCELGNTRLRFASVRPHLDTVPRPTGTA